MKAFGIGSVVALFTCLSGPALAQTTVSLAGYEGTFQTVYTTAVLEPFMKAHPDIKIEYFPIGNSAQVLGMVRTQKDAPQLDLAIMDVTVAKAGTEEGLFVPVDEKVSPHVADLYPNARVKGVDGVGLTFDSTAIVYNKRAFSQPPTSINVLKDPAHKGRVALYAPPNMMGLFLTVSLEAANGGTDFVKRLNEGISAMEEIAPNVLTWDPRPDPYALINNNQIDVGFNLMSKSQYSASQEGSSVGSVVPDEGALLSINTINLVKNAPNEAAAKTVVDYMLSPEAQKAFAEAMFYAPTNQKAEISDEIKSKTIAGSMDKIINIDLISLAGIRDRVTQDWRRRVIPLSK